MSRLVPVSILILALAVTLTAQNNPPRPKTVDFESLGKFVVSTGLKTETGQGVYKVTYPGDDGWFVEVWLSKTSPLVLVTFPCQGLPTNHASTAPLLQLLAQNGQMDGTYFGYNEKTKNFYLECAIPADGLTVEKLKAELDRMQKVAIKSAGHWDTSKWTEMKDEVTPVKATQP